MTTHSHPRPHPDRRHDAASTRDDVSREFWGDDAGWLDRAAPTVDAQPYETVPVTAGIGAKVGRWWSAASTRRTAPTRQHTSRTSATPAMPTSPGDVFDGDAFTADGAFDDTTHDDTCHDGAFDDEMFDDGMIDDGAPTGWNETWDAAPPPARPGVDPLLARLGGLAVVLTLLVPVVMGFASGSDDGDAVRTAAVPVTIASATSTDATVEQPASTDAGTPPVAATAPSATPPATDAAAATNPAPSSTATEATTTALAAQALVADTCALDYEVVSGDFWIRIADGSGASLADLLDVNGATSSTPLYPGRSICLPAGATTPPPPVVTTAPKTTAKTASSGSSSSSKQSSTSSSSSGATSSGSKPKTTTPPTTAAPSPPPARTASAAEVEAIIRSVWPDDLEERALQIAWRESNLNPSARNSCCYGLFQVYWNVHRSWLSGLGITSVSQLYDPATNARAALGLYQRAGGWGPWGG